MARADDRSGLDDVADPVADEVADPAVDDHRSDGTLHDRFELLREAAIQAEYATGVEEATEAEARRHVIVRLGTIGVGFVVLIGGLVMLVLPGPGILGVLAGLGILSRELPWAERVMEYVQKRARIDELKQQPAWIQATMWTLTIVAVGSSFAYFTVIR